MFPKRNPVNPAQKYNSGKVEVSSTYSGCNPENLIDGLRNHRKLPWNRAGWASEEKPEKEQWVEILLPQKTTIKNIDIYWAFDNGKYFSSSEIIIQIPAGNNWKNIGRLNNIPPNTPQSDFSPPPSIGEVDKIRFIQPKGKGPGQRPNIMWIAEIEIIEKK